METPITQHLDVLSTIKTGFHELKLHPLAFLLCLLLLTADHFAFRCLINLNYLEPLPWLERLIIFPLFLIFLVFLYLRAVVQLLFLHLIQKKAGGAGRIFKKALSYLGNFFLNIAWILRGILTIVPAFRRLVLSILIVLKIDREEKCGWDGLKEIERRAGGKWVDLLWIALVTSLISIGVFLIPALIPGIPKSDIRALRIDVVNLFLLLILNKYFGFFHEEKLPDHSVPV